MEGAMAPDTYIAEDGPYLGRLLILWKFDATA
jgi:hypothetical protein